MKLVVLSFTEDVFPYRSVALSYRPPHRSNIAGGNDRARKFFQDNFQGRADDAMFGSKVADEYRQTLKEEVYSELGFVNNSPIPVDAQ